MRASFVAEAAHRSEHAAPQLIMQWHFAKPETVPGRDIPSLGGEKDWRFNVNQPVIIIEIR